MTKTMYKVDSFTPKEKLKGECFGCIDTGYMIPIARESEEEARKYVNDLNKFLRLSRSPLAGRMRVIKIIWETI